MGGNGRITPGTRGGRGADAGLAQSGSGGSDELRRASERTTAGAAAGKVVDLRQAARSRATPAQESVRETALTDLVEAARRTQRLKRDEALYPEPSAAPASSAAAGAEAAFWQVWLRHSDHLRRQSLRLMAGNRADAEDALSTAMLKASQKFGEYADSIINERAWLTRLLHNACMDVYRGHKRQARWAPEAPLGEEPQDPLPQLAAENDRSPEEIAVGRETLQQLEQQIEALPPNLRLPFVMRFLHNRSYDEIAGRLELTNCAVRKRIQLARERLRSKIER